MVDSDNTVALGLLALSHASSERTYMFELVALVSYQGNVREQALGGCTQRQSVDYAEYATDDTINMT